MKGIEVLVSDMVQRADPDRRCGRKVKEGQSKGGKVRAGQVALKNQRTMELLNSGLSSGQVAVKLQGEGHGSISASGVRKIKQRF